VLHQQTLKKSVSFSGIGLHSGNRVNMTFLPSTPNTGIRFRRVDLDGHPEVEARIENVFETNRSTTLAKGNVKVHTVEHILSTFAGLGVDNAIVEIDANEPPIADGSSRQYLRMVQSAGIVTQAEKRDPLTISSPIEIKQGETMMSIFPHPTLKISCTSTDRQGRFTQFLSLIHI
jgi:UDP-3-O-[3-hydroxymyristoyl] N-acetylglucosamine deacetylase/3-hydroxyacyl-[acyl-carrier-protein] dehydratase